VPRPRDQKHALEYYSKSCRHQHRVLAKITSSWEVTEANGRHSHDDVVGSFKDAAHGSNVHFKFNLIAQEQEQGKKSKRSRRPDVVLMKKSFHHQQRVKLYSHESANSSEGNQIWKVYPNEVGGQDEESGCYIDEKQRVVQLTMIPDELVSVPGFALLDNAVFRGIIHERLDAWIENTKRLHSKAERLENEVRVGAAHVADTFLIWTVLCPSKVNSLTIPRSSNPLPRYFLVIHDPKLEYDYRIEALDQNIPIIKVFYCAHLY
jgi:hypothetical protein